MNTLRRLYLYAVALVSLETVIWGVIGLARGLLAALPQDLLAARIATSLSLVLVGLPVFAVHWFLAQRRARVDAQERSARLRAVFLYAVLFAAFLPAVLNTRSILEITFNQILRIPAVDRLATALVDHLAVIIANLLAAAWGLSILRADWRAGPVDEEYAGVRRLHRHLWLLIGLGLAVLGAAQTLSALIRLNEPGEYDIRFELSSGLAQLLVGAPVWLFAGRILSGAWVEQAERRASTRLVALSLLLATAAGATLVSTYGALRQALLPLLGEMQERDEFLRFLGPPLGSLLPLSGAWLYARRLLSADLKPAALEPGSTPRAGRGRSWAFARRTLDRFGRLRRQFVPSRLPELRRLYDYALALFGLAGSLYGLHELIAVLVDRLLGAAPDDWRRTLAQGIAALAVGLPVWLGAWTQLSREVALEGEPGERARRSLTRRSFLYATLFAGVIGAMFSAGAMVYQLVRAALGEPEPELLLNTLQQLKSALLFALLGLFHWSVMRQDGEVAERAMRRRQAQFPVLVLAPDEGPFADVLVQALAQETPEAPVAVHPYSHGAPDETLSAAKAVLLPGELLVRPSEALRLWLQGYHGQRVVLPTPVEGWQWASELQPGEDTLRTLARQAARQVRRLVEGERPPETLLSGSWRTVVIVAAVIGGFLLLTGLINLAMEFSP